MNFTIGKKSVYEVKKNIILKFYKKRGRAGVEMLYENAWTGKENLF